MSTRKFFHFYQNSKESLVKGKFNVSGNKMLKIRNIFIVCFILMGFSKLYAQDTLIFRNGQLQTGKILFINKYEVKYKRSSYPDGPIYFAKMNKICEIRLQDGTKQLWCDPQNNFKLFNPYFYFQTGGIDAIFAIASPLNYFGFGHDGLFKFLSIGNNTFQAGALYSTNLLYGGIVMSYGHSYYQNEHKKYEHDFFEFQNLLGLQIDAGTHKIRFFVQGLAGPTYTHYYGKINQEAFVLTKGFGFGIKSGKSKFGTKVLFDTNNYIKYQVKILFRYGLEF